MDIPDASSSHRESEKLGFECARDTGRVRMRKGQAATIKVCCSRAFCRD